MSLRPSPRIIVVRPRRKKSSGGHHGGSWKVAYADFVTAMMAFFMVMWIVGMDEDVKDVVEGYFNDPIGFKRGYATGSSAALIGGDLVTYAPDAPARGGERSPLEVAADEIRAGVERLALQGVEAEISVSVTAEGLRVEMAEGADGETFFRVGSALPEDALARVLEVVGGALAPLANPIVVEGHTDSAPYAHHGYTNWELSVDRANAARRVLNGQGVGEERVVEVRGHADRQLRYPDDPRNPGNRRVTLFVASTPDLAGASAVGALESVGR